MAFQAPGKGKAHRSQRDSSCLCLHDPEYSERVTSSYLRSSTKSKSSTHTGQQRGRTMVSYSDPWCPGPCLALVYGYSWNQNQGDSTVSAFPSSYSLLTLTHGDQPSLAVQRWRINCLLTHHPWTVFDPLRRFNCLSIQIKYHGNNLGICSENGHFWRNSSLSLWVRCILLWVRSNRVFSEKYLIPDL